MAQLGSEHWTRPVLKWSKPIQLSNGPFLNAIWKLDSLTIWKQNVGHFEWSVFKMVRTLVLAQTFENCKLNNRGCWLIDFLYLSIRFISFLFIATTIFSLSFCSSIGGKPPVPTNRYDKFINFLLITHRFRFETILMQDLGSQALYSDPVLSALLWGVSRTLPSLHPSLHKIMVLFQWIIFFGQLFLIGRKIDW